MQRVVVNAAEIRRTEHRGIEILTEGHRAELCDAAHHFKFGAIDTAIAREVQRAGREDAHCARAQRRATRGHHLHVTSDDVRAAGVVVSGIREHQRAHGAVTELGQCARARDDAGELDHATRTVAIGLEGGLAALNRRRSRRTEAVKVGTADLQRGVAHIERTDLPDVALADATGALIHIHQRGTTDIQREPVRAVRAEAHREIVVGLGVRAAREAKRGRIAAVAQIQRAAVEVHRGWRAAIGPAKGKRRVIDENAAGVSDAVDVRAARVGVLAAVRRAGAVTIDGQHPRACFEELQVAIQRAGEERGHRGGDGECGGRAGGVGDAAAKVHTTARASDLAVVCAEGLHGDAAAVQIERGTGVDVELAVQPAERIGGTQLQRAVLNIDFSWHRAGVGERERAVTKLREVPRHHVAGDDRIFARLHKEQRLAGERGALISRERLGCGSGCGVHIHREDRGARDGGDVGARGDVRTGDAHSHHQTSGAGDGDGVRIRRCRAAGERCGARGGRINRQIAADGVASVEEDTTTDTRTDVRNGQSAAGDIRRRAEGINAVQAGQRLRRGDVANRGGIAAGQGGDRCARIRHKTGRGVICDEIARARGIGGDEVRSENAVREHRGTRGVVIDGIADDQTCRIAGPHAAERRSRARLQHQRAEILAHEVVRSHFDAESGTALHLERQTAAVVVVRGAGRVYESDVRAGVHRADDAADHFDVGVIRRGAGAVRPRGAVGELQRAIGHRELAQGVVVVHEGERVCAAGRRVGGKREGRRPGDGGDRGPGRDARASDRHASCEAVGAAGGHVRARIRRREGGGDVRAVDDPGTRAGFEGVIELCALQDDAAGDEGVRAGHIDATTIDGGAVVVKLDAARGRHVRIDAQRAAGVAGVRAGAADGEVPADLNVTDCGAGGITERRLIVDLQHAIRHQQAYLSVAAVQHHGAQTALHDEVCPIIRGGGRLREGQTGLRIEPAIAAVEADVAIQREGVLPERKTATCEHNVAAAGQIRGRIDRQETASHRRGAGVGHRAGQEEISLPCLDEMAVAAAHTIADAAVRVELARVGAVDAQIELSHRAAGAWREVDHSAEMEITGLVLHLHRAVRREVERVADGQRGDAAEVTHVAVRLERAAIQGDRANSRRRIHRADAQGTERLHHRGTTVGHRHIILHRAAAVVHGLVGAARITSHRNTDLHLISGSSQRGGHTQGALACAEAVSRAIRRQRPGINARVTQHRPQVGSTTPKGALIDVLAETDRTDAQRAFPRRGGVDRHGGQRGRIRHKTDAQRSDAADVRIHRELTGPDVRRRGEANAATRIQSDRATAERRRRARRVQAMQEACVDRHIAGVGAGVPTDQNAFIAEFFEVRRASDTAIDL